MQKINRLIKNAHLFYGKRVKVETGTIYFAPADFADTT